MPALTRRAALQACVGILAVGAGCNGESVSRSNSEPGTPTGEVHTDLETHALRTREHDPVVAESESDVQVPSAHLFVDEADLETLRFVREPEGTADVRSFAEETTFDRESLFVVQQPIGQCYRLAVSYADRDEDSFRLETCRVLRDASVPCEADVRELAVTFVRLPFAFDEVPRGYSISGGSDCPRPDGGDGA